MSHKKFSKSRVDMHMMIKTYAEVLNCFVPKDTYLLILFYINTIFISSYVKYEKKFIETRLKMCDAETGVILLKGSEVSDRKDKL